MACACAPVHSRHCQFMRHWAQACMKQSSTRLPDAVASNLCHCDACWRPVVVWCPHEKCRCRHMCSLPTSMVNPGDVPTCYEHSKHEEHNSNLLIVRLHEPEIPIARWFCSCRRWPSVDERAPQEHVASSSIGRGRTCTSNSCGVTVECVSRFASTTPCGATIAASSQEVSSRIQVCLRGAPLVQMAVDERSDGSADN